MCLKAVKLVYCRHRNLKCYEWGFWQWKVKRLCFEYDTDPYYQALDVKVKVKFVSLRLKVLILLTTD